MATAPPAARLTWATFALTDPRWLVHATAWSVILTVALWFMPWLFTGFLVVAALGVLASTITAGTGVRDAEPLAPATLLRYALVDSIFVAFAAPFVVVPLHFALAAMELLSFGGAPRYGLILTIAFVWAFYASLWAIGLARTASSAWRRLPVAAAAVAVALLVWQGWSPYSDHSQRSAARDAGAAAYERSTGKRPDRLDRLRIGNSLAGFESRVGSISVDSRGRLLVSGAFSFYAGRDARALVRLLPDGQLDTTFAPLPAGDPGMIAPSRVLPAADGSIVVNRLPAGSGGAASGLSRLREDGTVDRTFRLEIPFDQAGHDPPDAFDTWPDGSLVTALPSPALKGVEDACVVRVLPDGARDLAFERAATLALYGAEARDHRCSVQGVAVLSSGQVMVAGAFPATATRPALVRLEADGRRDERYATVDLFNASRWWLGRGGEVFVVFYDPVPDSKKYKARLVRHQPDGRPDPGFRPPSEGFWRIDEIAIQHDGKAIVAGSLADRHGVIARLRADGSLDDTFGGVAGPPSVDGFLTSMAIQRDGRIMVGGEFLEIGGPAKAARMQRNNIARLMPDGTVDASFAPR